MKIFHSTKFLVISLSLLVTACSSNRPSENNEELSKKGLAEYSQYADHNKHIIINNSKRLYELSTPYKDYIKTQATAKNMPKEIYAIPAIESAFNERAIASKNNTVGMWQLTSSMAKNEGLNISNNNDERKDWKKSTDASLEYINSNAKENFNNNFDLSVLAYNAGTGTVKKALKKYNTNDVWVIIQDKNIFKQETVTYFYKYVAYSNEFKKLDQDNNK